MGSSVLGVPYGAGYMWGVLSTYYMYMLYVGCMSYVICDIN